MNVDIDNAMQGVLHALIERHISREEAMESLRGIVGGMMPKHTVEVRKQHKGDPGWDARCYWVVAVNGSVVSNHVLQTSAQYLASALCRVLDIKEGA